MINGTLFKITAQVADHQRLAQSINDLQTQISTGQRISAPSDDPAAYARIAGIRREQADNMASQTGVARAAALSSRADSSIAGAQQLMDRANETLLGAASGTTSAGARLIAAEALRGMAQDMRRLADTRDSSGAPLFGDVQATAVPVGDDVIEAVPARQSVFSVTIGGQNVDLADAISTAADRLSQSAGDATYTATVDIAVFATASAQLNLARTSIGFTGQRLEELSTRLDARDVDLSIAYGALADTDIADAIARITAQQTSLQAAQAMFARINQSGLFDLLN